MKINKLEQKFIDIFQIPFDYNRQLSHIRYLQLGALAYNCSSVKDFKREILERCIDNKGGIDECITQIFSAHYERKK